MSEVVTRFAPSPTGHLHIGGARTALFNWLFARSKKGKFLLRIEDTDRERSTSDAEKAILEGLEWLELDWDPPLIRQHSRIERHVEICKALLKYGQAYRCYSTPEEIETIRQYSRKIGLATLFSSPWREVTESSQWPDKPFTIRLKTPNDGSTAYRDHVFGDLSWLNKSIEDPVILRADGSPTYNLAVVVDDHDMDISHVIRGDDHLANTAKQQLIYKSLNWQIPEFAHLPLIYGEDGKKLSKRSGSIGIDAYAEQGYLPEAVRNYLARLGWSHGDYEYFTTQQTLDWFDLSGIRKAPARLDSKKLRHLSGLHMNASLKEYLIEQIDQFPNTKLDHDSIFRSRLMKALPILLQRAKTIVELLDNAEFLSSQKPLVINDQSQDILQNTDWALFKEVKFRISSSNWGRDDLESALLDVCKKREMKLGKIVQPIRAALVGKSISPSVFDVMILIGRDETIERLDYAEKYIDTMELATDNSIV